MKSVTTFTLLAILFVAAACGVRGRPQPPLEPAFIGRGKPSFKRATEDYAFPEVPSPEATPQPKRKSQSGGKE